MTLLPAHHIYVQTAIAEPFGHEHSVSISDLCSGYDKRIEQSGIFQHVFDLSGRGFVEIWSEVKQGVEGKSIDTMFG